MKATFRPKMTRSFSNKNLKQEFALSDCFCFKFAGNCELFISKSRLKYKVCRIGFKNFNGLIMFNHNEVSHLDFKTLYQAIQYFIYEVNLICSSLDWYKSELFNSEEFYNFANERLFE